MQMVRPLAESCSTLCSGAVESTTRLAIPQPERRRALVVPREHEAWGILLVPLGTGAVGLLAGGRIAPVLLLTMAALALFCLRTPVQSWLGTSAVRVQTREERQLVSRVVLPLATGATVTVGALFWQRKNRELIWLGMIAGAYWANRTWGSYWSWDPKETWAAITWLVYAWLPAHACDSRMAWPARRMLRHPGVCRGDVHFLRRDLFAARNARLCLATLSSRPKQLGHREWQSSHRCGPPSSELAVRQRAHHVCRTAHRWRTSD